MIPAWVAMTAIIWAAAVFAALYPVLKWLGKSGKVIRINDKKKPDIRAKTPDRPAGEISAEYAAKLEEDLQAYLRSYNSMLDRMNIPSGALTAVKCTCIFSLEHVALSHYVWCRGDTLCFFPKWRDIAFNFLDPSYIPVTEGKNRDLIFGWAIPVDFITYYVVDEVKGITVVYYEDKNNNRRYKTVFLDGGGHVFRTLFPEKDYDFLKRRRYLGSYGSILEMNERISQLKARVEQGLISGEEYEIQKEYIMRNF